MTMTLYQFFTDETSVLKKKNTGKGSVYVQEENEGEITSHKIGKHKSSFKYNEFFIHVFTQHALQLGK